MRKDIGQAFTFNRLEPEDSVLGEIRLNYLMGRTDLFIILSILFVGVTLEGRGW